MKAKPPEFRVIGRSTPKVDAAEKVTGAAQFGADVKLQGLLIGKILHSPYAHARIRRINTSKAEKLPGVKAVITGKDFPTITLDTQSPYGTITDREYYLSKEIMARDKVVFHSHPVAAVAV